MAAQVPRDAGAGDAANLRCDLLDHNHQRKAEDEGPGKAIAELGSDLAMCADTAGVVVSGTRYETGTQGSYKSSALANPCGIPKR